LSSGGWIPGQRGVPPGTRNFLSSKATWGASWGALFPLKVVLTGLHASLRGAPFPRRKGGPGPPPSGSSGPPGKGIPRMGDTRQPRGVESPHSSPKKVGPWDSFSRGGGRRPKTWDFSWCSRGGGPHRRLAYLGDVKMTGRYANEDCRFWPGRGATKKNVSGPGVNRPMESKKGGPAPARTRAGASDSRPRAVPWEVTDGSHISKPSSRPPGTIPFLTLSTTAPLGRRGPPGLSSGKG